MAEIGLTIPEQPKNWLILLLEYVIVLSPQIIFPSDGNPIVESTVIIEDQIGALLNCIS